MRMGEVVCMTDERVGGSPSDARAVRVFLGSIVYLPLLLLFMVADKLLA
jgi:heme O synthase-like polyprenyltransferase